MSPATFESKAEKTIGMSEKRSEDESEIVLQVFNEGDGIGVHQAQSIRLIAQDELVALWFDLPADN